MKKLHFLSLVIVAAVLLTGVHAGAQDAADSVNFQLLNDYSNFGFYAGTQGTVYTGTGADPAAGSYWNNNGYSDDVNFTSGPLTASDGSTPTTISVTFSGASDYANTDVPNNLFSAYDYSNSGSFTVSGLAPDEEYNLYLYAYSNPNSPSTFVIGANSQTTTNAGIESSGATASTIPASDQGISFVEFTVEADTSGDITGTYTNAVNGLQISPASLAVPEPSTWTMMFIALGILFGLQRFRRSSSGTGSTVLQD